VNNNKLKKNTFQYLEEKNKMKEAIRLKEIKLEENKLELEKERLAFEKQKFDFEREEKIMKAELDAEARRVELSERKAMVQLYENQNLLLKEVLRKF